MENKKMLTLRTDYFMADVTQINDYFPFGSLLPGRNFNANQYRFGFGGQEKDDEVFGSTGTSYTAEFWQYDSRLGRRWNLDPKPNPSISQYATFNLNPIMFTDVLGDTIRYRSLRVSKINYKKNEKINYEYYFKRNISDKRKQRLISKFEKKSAPIIEAMSKTKLGRYDIYDMMNMDTKIKLKLVNNKAGNRVGATKGFGLTTNGSYKSAKIKLYKPTLIDAINVSGNYRNLEESFHAIGAHERIHLNPTQIKIDNNKSLLYYQKEQATYKHQIDAIHAYWNKYGKTPNSNIDKKIESFINTGIMP